MRSESIGSGGIGSIHGGHHLRVLGALGISQGWIVRAGRRRRRGQHRRHKLLHDAQRLDDAAVVVRAEGKDVLRRWRGLAAIGGDWLRRRGRRQWHREEGRVARRSWWPSHGGRAHGKVGVLEREQLGEVCHAGSLGKDFARQGVVAHEVVNNAKAVELDDVAIKHFFVHDIEELLEPFLRGLVVECEQAGGEKGARKLILCFMLIFWVIYRER